MTKRLILRKLKGSDANDIKSNISKIVVKWLTDIPFPYTLEDAEEYVNGSITNLRNRSSYNFGIVFEGSLIGTISLGEVDWRNKRARIAYLLNEGFWGRGIMSEAVGCVLEYGFRNLKLNKIYTGVVAENKVSCKILKKFGFEKGGVNRKHCFIRGKYYDEVVFSLLRSDWENLVS